ncbi:MAG: helix-turn-helix domain-containing protein [Crocosphaera sp.]|nr:helix-turn-helix domain-containing protein [Crocosphaera sp.]
MINLLNWVLRLKVGLGEWLLLRRRSLGLTQKKLASELGVTSQTVSNWETSKAIPTLTIGQTKKLCQLLQCQLDEIPSEDQ